ncbi:hypothetical protein WJX77_009419 [Trebouxia sp. C0004]
MASPPARSLLRSIVVLATLLVQAQCALQQSKVDSDRAGRQHAAAQPKVAIIGAGIGGAFTAYNLRQLLNSTVELHVFEGKDVGGRVQTFSYEGHAYEAGASIVFSKNYYVRDAADKLALKRVPPEGSSEDLFSIYDGSRFVFRQSEWTVITLWRMVQRYWLTYFTFQAPTQMLQKFLRLYDLQSQGRSFDTPEAFLRELGLYDLTQQSMHTYLQKSLGSSTASRRFATEFVAAVNKVNYNQDSGLNAFAGMVSMLPTVNPDLFKIDGGNVQVPQMLLDHAHPDLHKSNVTKIVKSSDGTFQIKTLHQESSHMHGPFAAVVIATPLEFSSIEFEGVELPHIPARKFQSTVSTFVRGHLNGSYFGLKARPKGTIMVSEHAGTPFSVISPARQFADKTILYKIFSTNAMQKQALRSIFVEHEVIGTFPWYAYPKFQPPEQYAPFKLADGLFYGNAWENAASCMEISAISAMNSALHVQQKLNPSSAPMLFNGAARNAAIEL